MTEFFANRLAQTGLIAVTLSLALAGAGPSLAGDDARPADDSALPPGLSTIAKRFGNQSPKLLALSLLIDLMPAGSDDASLKEAVALTAQALDQSNAGPDLAAAPVPTGDALFDRYALAVDARINALAVEEAQQVMTVAALPDAELAAWETEFGQDSHYWELRYLCAKALGDQAELGAGFQAPRDILAEARARGIATTNTLLLLFNELRDEHAQALEPFTNYGPEWQQWWENQFVAEHIPARPQFDSALVQQSAELQSRFEAEELALLDEAIATGPDQAWGYYYRALYWYELGEDNHGLADLTRGNAAPNWSRPLPYPCGMVLASAKDASPVGSAVICGAQLGALMHSELLLGLSQPLVIKTSLRDALSTAAPCDSDSVYEQWHQFACRFGTNSADQLGAMVGTVLINMIRQSFEESSIGTLAQPQQETLQRILGAQEDIKLRWRAYSDFDPISVATVLAVVGGARGVATASYLSTWNEGLIGTNCAPLFTDQAQVHYPELSLPECMLKYEALTREELDHRRAAEKAERQAEREAAAATETDTESQ